MTRTKSTSQNDMPGEYRAHPLSNSQIRKLRTEAAKAGDLRLTTLCDSALAGDNEARVGCTGAFCAAARETVASEGGHPRGSPGCDHAGIVVRGTCQECGEPAGECDDCGEWACSVGCETEHLS